MPKASVLLIRTSFVYLLLGFSLGGLLLANKGLPLNPRLWQFLPAHIDFLFFGWTVQLAMGVAFWILPRFRQAPKRGDPRIMYASYTLLNAGIFALLVAPAFSAAAWLPVTGRLAEAAAVLLFGANTLPRIGPRE
jgi:heme/copper-type cytochrome/quinol oxidase subunit 1